MHFLKTTTMFTSVIFYAMGFIALTPTISKAEHLSNSQCYEYFTCILGKDSALNRCYDNKYLNEIGTTRVTCMRIAQHQCKVKTGIQGTGKKMTNSRPLNWYHRPTLLDHEAGVEALVAEDIRIYNYAGWNHCPVQYQGLQDFWCDPHQLRYPPRPWCDLMPNYNVTLPDYVPKLDPANGYSSQIHRPAQPVE